MNNIIKYQYFKYSDEDRVKAPQTTLLCYQNILSYIFTMIGKLWTARSSSSYAFSIQVTYITTSYQS
jgi:hypothetical protein